jgi:hypothetical protein
MNDDGQLTGPARIADPTSSPLRGSGGTGERKPPTWTGSATRWSARARVVPITGIAAVKPGLVLAGNRPTGSKRGGAVTYAAVVEWHGPPLPEFGIQPRLQAIDAITETIVTDHEHARAICVAALELIDDGQVPYIDSLRDALRDPDTWRARYHELVGDDGRAAAAGYL